MKPLSWILLLFIGFGVVLFFSTLLKSSHYVHFDEARKQTTGTNKGSVYVIGTLVRDKEQQVVGIEEAPHHMAFSFLLQDKEGMTERVYYGDVMPMDFRRAEQVVVIGGYDHSDRFRAEKLLMKCPSKYVETQVAATKGR